MTFAAPQLLYLLALLPLMAALAVWVSRRRQAAIARLGDPRLVDRLSMSVNWRGRRWRGWLWFVAIALIVVAVARPQWGTELQVIERRGVQIMVALDVSQSMLAEDIKPDRLSRAKLEIVDLMNRLGGDEIGLVLFSGASFIQFPLTFDYTTARVALDDAAPDVISRPGTAVGDAILMALRGFDEKRTSQKVIVLMTDGEDHEGDPVEAARQAADEGVIIYAIGFGTPQGDPIPEYDGSGQVIGYKKDRSGEVVLSRLDEATLQQVASVTNGEYYRASAGAGAVESLAAELAGLQKAEIESEFETRNVERFQWSLLGALLALLIAEVIPDRVTNLIGRLRRAAATT